MLLRVHKYSYGLPTRSRLLSRPSLRPSPRNRFLLGSRRLFRTGPTMTVDTLLPKNLSYQSLGPDSVNLETTPPPKKLQDEPLPGEQEFNEAIPLLIKCKIPECIALLESSAGLEYPLAYMLLYRLYDGALGGPTVILEKVQDYKQKASACVDFYQEAANNGDAVAQCLLALCYRFGIGVEINQELGFEWSKKAALQGHPLGQNCLGVCYSGSAGHERDKALAVENLKLAADQGLVTAYYTLGVLYEQTKEFEKGVEMYRIAGEQGHAWAMCNLGHCYRWGRGVARNYKRAVACFKTSARQGHEHAHAYLGECYENGWGIPQDLAKAAKHYLYAVENGEPTPQQADAQYTLGTFYETGQAGLDQNPQKAADLYLKAIQQRNRNAMLKLGSMYEDGRGVKKDLKLAKYYYTAEETLCFEEDLHPQPSFLSHTHRIDRINAKIAAERGDSDALLVLSDLYEWGRGVEEDRREAVRCYELAVEKNNLAAMTDLALCYFSGRGVEIDPAKGLEYLSKAADLGFPRAFHELGRLYATGQHSVPIDTTKSFECHLKATDSYFMSFGYVGAAYFLGLGTEQNDAEAAKYLKMYSEGGHHAVWDLPPYAELGRNLPVAESMKSIKKKNPACIATLDSSVAAWRASRAQRHPFYQAIPLLLKNKMPECIALLERAAAMEYPLAYALLSCLYGGALGGPFNSEKSQFYAKKARSCSQDLSNAAKTGDPIAQCLSGYCRFDWPLKLRKSFVFGQHQKSALQGHPLGQYNLGLCYLHGEGVDKDLKLAYENLKLAADQGMVAAYHALGEYYEETNDFEKAVEMFRLAGEEGYAASLCSLGSCYKTGRGVDPERFEEFLRPGRDLEAEKEAARLYKLAMETGDMNAVIKLGDCYQMAIGVECDMSKAMELYEKAAEAGFAQAQFLLSSLYKTGSQAVEPNPKLHFEYALMAAKQDFPAGCYAVGVAYMNGFGTEINEQASDKWFRKYAVLQPSPESFALMAWYCNEGAKSFEKNPSKAFRLYSLAVEQGHVHSLHQLADCYLKGRGTWKDPIKGIKLLRKAANQGLAHAQYDLGLAYQEGTHGLDQDLAKAFKSFRKAADPTTQKGHPQACFEVGVCYANGTGVSQNLKKAVKYYLLAVDAGDENAPFNLAECYEQGKGVQKDQKLADVYYEMATKRQTANKR